MGYTAKLSMAVLYILALAMSQIVQGEELPLPGTDVLLVITGELANANAGDEVHLDLAALQSLPVTELTTVTPWHEQARHFTGVRVSTLLEAIGSEAAEFVAVGLDDYRFTVADFDFEKYPVIIAYLQDGRPMSIRNLGPLRIIMPFSDYPELKKPLNESRSVWHLVALELL